MTNAMKRTGLAAAIAGLIGAGACSGNKTQPIDDGLKADLAAVGGASADLQLAPTAAKSQVVVSAIEGGPQSAPKKAAPARVAKPSPRAVTHAAPSQPAPAPTVQAEQQAPAPVQHAPVMEAPAPAPAPAPREDHRVYKTEGEIFRQMPWIRP